MAKLDGVPTDRLARLGAVLAIVLGIFVMHGLSLHGTSHSGAPALDAPVAHSLLDVDAPPERHHADASASSGGTNDTLRDVAMLCLATLAAAAALLALMSVLRRVPRVWAVLLPVIDNWPRRWLPPAGTGPPPTWRFSVIRC